MSDSPTSAMPSAPPSSSASAPARRPFAPTANIPLAAVMRTITLDPVPRWPVLHRNIRALHGVLTASVWREPHNAHHPCFALLPWPQSPSLWAALWVGDRVERARALPSRHSVSVFNAVRTLTLGPPVSPLAPAWTEGESVMCVDTVTPVSISIGLQHDLFAWDVGVGGVAPTPCGMTRRGRVAGLSSCAPRSCADKRVWGPRAEMGTAKRRTDMAQKKTKSLLQVGETVLIQPLPTS